MGKGIVLVNWHNNKLFVFVSILLVCLLACFLVGGLVAPKQYTEDNALASKCLNNDNNTWFYNEKCNPGSNLTTNDIVYTFQIPTPQGDSISEYSRWQQSILGELQFDIDFYSNQHLAHNFELTLDVKIGFSNREDKANDWKLYASSVEKRILNCVAKNFEDGTNYKCDFVPLFEFGSLHHNYYLINIKIQINEESGINNNLKKINDVWLVVLNQNEGFTRVMLYLKTTFFLIMIATMRCFLKKLHKVGKNKLFLEQMILTIGFVLILLNFPIEFLTLYFNIPFMLLIQEIKQVIFYATLFLFWLIFVNEHFNIQNTQQIGLRTYGKHLIVIICWLTFILVFGIYDKGVLLKNPFNSIWVSNVNTHLNFKYYMHFAVGGSYILFLSFMIWRVFCKIDIESLTFSSTSNSRKLEFELNMYRFKCFLIVTLLCAAITVFGFILGQVSLSYWKRKESDYFNCGSSFLVGVYGMWNLYIFAVCILYSPFLGYRPIQFDVLYNLGDSVILFTEEVC